MQSPLVVSNATVIWAAVIAALAPCALIAVKWFFDLLADERRRRLVEAQSWTLQQVKAELTEDSGESTKDQAQKGAAHSQKAAEDSAKALEMLEEMKARLEIVNELRADVGELKTKMDDIDEKVQHLDHELMAHKQNNEKWKHDLLVQLKIDEQAAKSDANARQP